MSKEKERVFKNYKSLAEIAIQCASSYPCNLCIYHIENTKKSCYIGYVNIGACPIVKEIRRRLNS